MGVPGEVDCRLRTKAPVAALLQAPSFRGFIIKLLTFISWLVLLALCWPLALLALVLWPLAWLVLLPFRLVGITFEALFALLRAVLLLPARMLGGNARAT